MIGLSAFFSLTFFVFQLAQANLNQRVIYGTDNRKDIFEVSDQNILLNSQSTVALVETKNLILLKNKSYKLKSTSYGKFYDLCPSEAFYAQETVAFCSGSLIGEDLILTAGHCVQSEYDCENTAFIFDYSYKVKDSKPSSLNSENIFYCQKIIQSKHSNQADFAIIRLDRKVLNRAPLKYRTMDKISDRSELYVIGHPAGIPTKITDSGVIRSNNQEAFFTTNLDTYGGNSGSAVFNSQTNMVEGILVRGENDFIKVGGCYISNVCNEDACRGEDVTRITEILPYLR
jgi:V8-like Glu-specific endopeptidase